MCLNIIYLGLHNKIYIIIFIFDINFFNVSCFVIAYIVL
jgi:hypothetical protein